MTELPAKEKSVYALLFKNSSSQEMLLMTESDTDSEAAIKSKELITGYGFKPEDWTLAMINKRSLELIQATQRINDSIHESLSKKDEPVENFIYSLKYVSDNFTTNRNQKTVISNVIKNIEKKYEKDKVRSNS